MGLSRRGFLAGLAGAAAHAAAQTGAVRPAPRSKPLICLYSQVLIDIDAYDLPMIVRGLGFDGCNLTVMPGGHVPPAKADLNLMPALEALTGAGLEVPIISTAFTGLADPQAAQVLGLAGLIGVGFFRPGSWRFDRGDPNLLRQIAGLAAAGRAYKMMMGIANTTRIGGASMVDTLRTIRALDPHWVGFDFDPSVAAADSGPEALAGTFAMTQSRLKMVTARDCRVDRQAGGAAPAPCPLGEGMVDWPVFCGLLARAGFAGPITLQIDYPAADKPAAIRRDLEFLRRHIDAAYAEADKVPAEPPPTAVGPVRP